MAHSGYVQVQDKLINSLIKKFDVVEYKTKIEDGCKKGDSYAGILKKLLIEGKEHNGKPFTLHLFLKQSPTDEIWSKLFNCEARFHREINMYDTVLPNLKKLEEEFGLRDRIRLPMIYGISNEKGTETLIMENLTFQGYEMKNRRNPLDLQHCKAVMVYFAKLHSLSFILKKQKPELYAELSHLPDTFLSDEFVKYFEENKVYDTFESSIACLDQEKEFHLVEKVKEVFDNFVDNLEYCISGKYSNGYNVICHGDGWINNIFFKYKDQNHNTSPTSVCFIDWQLSRYASPLTDLIFFIYSSTDKELRDEHLQTLYETYYETLSSNLEIFGERVEELFPKEEFEKHIQIFSKLGLVLAMVILQGVLSNEDDSIEAVEIANDNENYQRKMKKKALSDNNFKDRMHGIIVDMYKRKYI